MDRALVLETLAREVQHAVSHGLGTLGITRALVQGFAACGLDTSSASASDIWDEAFIVIADRIPRVAPEEDPDPVYRAPDSDSGADVLGEINVAFTAAAISGLAHPGREQKRRSLLAVKTLIEHHAPGLGASLASALSSLSDPTTLACLLRVLEMSDEDAEPLLSECRNELVELTGRPHLVVRALARRLVPGGKPPLAPCGKPDPELVEHERLRLLSPFGAMVPDWDVDGLGAAIDELAGPRLREAEQILPRLGNAVGTRAASVRASNSQQRRLKAQLRAYGNAAEERWPDAFLANEEALEDAIQRAAAGARGARLARGEPLGDPVDLRTHWQTSC